MNEFIEPTLKKRKITKDNLLQYTDNCEAIRIGYNANIYPNCKNPNEIVKICLSGELDFLMEVYAMSVLGPENISPKLINYYWCNENIKLKDIVSKSAFKKNKKIRKLLDSDEEYEGVGIIIMEKIDNIILNSNESGIGSIYKRIVYKKIMKAYKLGFISMEPDVLVFRNKETNKENEIDARILDWGNYGGIKTAKDDYNVKNLNVVLEYLGLNKVKDSKIDTGEKSEKIEKSERIERIERIKPTEKVIKSKIQSLKELSLSEFEDKLSSEDLKLLHSVKIYLDDLYYNTGSEGLSDDKYDILKDYLQERDPEYVPPIGAKIREGENAVSLPFWLGSMNKIKYEGSSDTLRRWLNKHKADEYIIENKLDGISCLLEFKNGQIKLYTRGDGSRGSDISYLAPYLKNIPKNLPKKFDKRDSIYVRGELIMNKNTFQKKYAGEFANPRNMVAGRIGSKTLKSGISDIEFIAYEIVQENILPKPQEQLNTLQELGFKVVEFIIIEEDELTSERLLENLLYNIQESEYEIDGIIVQGNIKYKRNLNSNPDYAFAFKARLDTNLVDVVVDKVEWNISKWGVIKPRIKLKPVSLGGVTITYTSGFNAKYIHDNKIGPGSVLKLTRSGDVIPFIIEVVKKTTAQFPDMEYEWNDTKVDIYIKESNQITCIKLIASFFAALKIKYVSEATVTKMYENGLDNIIKIVSAGREDFEKIEGFGSRLAERTYENIQNGFKNIPLYLLLGASGVFGMGMGVRKIELLFNNFPNILTEYKKMKGSDLYQKINNIHGFSDKTTTKIIKNLPWAAKFVEKLSPFIKVEEEIDTKVSNEFMGKKIVFSGFRDAKLEEEIKKRGGKVTTTVSKNTSILVVLSNKEGRSSKIEKAKELNIPIYEIVEFRENFGL